jgi:hypothetical protein
VVSERTCFRSDRKAHSKKVHAKLEVDPLFKITLIALATFVTLALGASPSETAATEASLAGNVLLKTVSGKTVYLKISGFELPIRYSANGSMTGEHEHGRSRLGAGRRRL